MPGCAAVGCSNSSAKGFSMKSFPRDPTKRNKWIINTKRPNWIPTKNSCLCEVHFAPEMWEKVRVDGKKKLKHNAVPNIFPKKGIHMPDISNKRETIVDPLYENIPFSSTNDVNNITHMELDIKPKLSDNMETIVAEVLNDNIPSSTCTLFTELDIKPDIIKVESSNENTPSSSTNDNIIIVNAETDIIRLNISDNMERLVQASNENVPSSSSNTIINIKPDIRLNTSNNIETIVSKRNIPSPLSNSNDEITRVNMELSKLKQKLASYERMYIKERLRSAQYKKKLRLMKKQFAELKLKYEQDSLLSQMYSQDQIDVLLRKQTKKSAKFFEVSDSTIKKAHQLKLSCGNKVYTEMIRQGYPLPSIRTLQRNLKQ